MVEKSPFGVLKLVAFININQERRRRVTALTVTCKQSEVETITAQFFNWNPVIALYMDIESTFTITVRDYHHARKGS